MWIYVYNLNRDFIGIELDENYFEIAKKRIEETFNASKNKNRFGVNKFKLKSDIMEFCKTIREFDCTKFEEGRCYYVHWHDITGKSIKAIYLCDVVDKESNSIDLKRVVPIQGNCPARTIRFGSGDVNCIDEVQEIEMDVEYNTNWGWWKIECEIQPEIKKSLTSI